MELPVSRPTPLSRRCTRDDLVCAGSALATMEMAAMHGEYGVAAYETNELRPFMQVFFRHWRRHLRPMFGRLVGRTTPNTFGSPSM